MPETLFLEQHIDIVNRVTLQSFWLICNERLLNELGWQTMESRVVH